MSVTPFFIAISRPEENYLGVSVAIFLALVTIAFVRQQNNTISIAINSFFNIRFFRQSMREETITSIRLGRILLLNSFLIIAITLNYFLGSFIGLESEVLSLTLFFVGVLIWFLINILIKSIIASLSNIGLIQIEDRRYNEYFYQTLGLFLLPGIVGIYFFPNGLSTFLELYIKFIVLFLVLNKVIQSVFQSFQIKFSRFYIFLYICTLEILPLSIGFQLIIS